MFFLDGEVRILGHRGWPGRFPDNVLAGCMAAFDAADGAEVDVRRASDGTLVLAHDPTLVGHIVSETPWSVLARLDLGDGHRPVRLEDLLTVSGDSVLNLEVKNDPGDAGFEEDHRIALDTSAAARPQDLVSSFWWPSMDAVRVSRAAVETGLLFEDQALVEPALDHAVRLGHRAVIPHWRTIIESPDLIRSAHAAGIAVVTWTVDDPEVAAELARARVDAIITNDPAAVAAAVGRKR